MFQKKRCFWCNTKNPLYIDYHDKEWGVPNFEEQYLYSLLGKLVEVTELLLI